MPLLKHHPYESSPLCCDSAITKQYSVYYCILPSNLTPETRILNVRSEYLDIGRECSPELNKLWLLITVRIEKYQQSKHSFIFLCERIAILGPYVNQSSFGCEQQKPSSQD